MQGVPPSTVRYRWLVPVLLGVIAPLFLIAPRGAPGLTSGVIQAPHSAAWSRADAAFNALDTILGRLTAADEAMLRESLDGIRSSGTAAAPARRMEFWERRFAARLASATIPDGTRDSLAVQLHAYQHAILAARDTSPPR